MKEEKKDKTDDKKLVCSVIIPVYNAEKFIKDTLQSVINQTVKDIEIICVDDCSTDNSANIIKELQKKDCRIVLLTNEKNLKVSQTRNNGINFAHSDWIALLDADDMWEPMFLEEIIKRRDETGGRLICSSYGFIDNDGKKLLKEFHIKPIFYYKDFLKQNTISCSAVLVEKKLLLENPFYADEVHEDFLCWLTIMKQINEAYSINDCLSIYRLTTGSKSRNKFKAIKMSYKTYRKHGMGFFKAFYYTCCNAINGLKKYRKIKKGK